MKAQYLMKKYEQNGLNGGKLRSLQDLSLIHNIDYKEIRGFDTLSKENQEIFKYFIIAFYNSVGFKARATIIPKRIALVCRKLWYLNVKREDGTENIQWVKETHYITDTTGQIGEAISNDYDATYIKQLFKTHMMQDTYLRFDFEMYGEEEWMRLAKDGHSWG